MTANLSDLATPEAAVRAALDAVTARRWRDLASLGDEENLREFQRSWLQSLGDALAARDRPGADFPYQIVGPQRVEDVANLSAVDAATLWLELQDPVARRRRTFGHGPDAFTDDQLASIDRVATEVLGHVTEGPEVAHVVYTQVRPGYTPPDRPQSLAVTTRRTGDGRWRVLLHFPFLHGGVIESPPVRHADQDQ